MTGVTKVFKALSIRSNRVKTNKKKNPNFYQSVTVEDKMRTSNHSFLYVPHLQILDKTGMEEKKLKKKKRRFFQFNCHFRISTQVANQKFPYSVSQNTYYEKRSIYCVIVKKSFTLS